MIGRFLGFIGEHVDRLITIAYPTTNHHEQLLVEAETDRDVYEPLTSADGPPPAAAGPDPAGDAGSGQPEQTDSQRLARIANQLWCIALDETIDTAAELAPLIYELRDLAAQFEAIGD